MKHLTLALIFISLGVQASALSCMRPDVARSFHWAANADDTYVVLLGGLEFAQRPRQGFVVDPDPHSVTARFQGQFLGLSGFAPTPLDHVTLTFTCLGSWCGALSPGREVMAFAKQTTDGYVIEIDPCFSTVFDSPSAQDIAQMESCMRGGPCEERPLR